MSTNKVNIAIIGAGISGLALGCTLKQNGIDATIFEKSSEVSSHGAGISISKNGLKIIEYLNLSNDIKLNSYQPNQVEWRHNNKIFHQMPTETITMKRESLFSLLYEKYKKYGGEVVFDHELTSISLNGRELFFNNSKTYIANHVAACDGIRSLVRESFFKSSKPIYSGFTAWRGIGESINKNIEFNLGSNNHIVSYPVNKNLDRSFVGVIRNKNWSKESWKQEGSIEEILDQFNCYNDIIHSVFKTSKKIFKWGIFIRPQIKNIYKNNVTLLGDSAHPMAPFLGQGGCMSLEDSFVFGTLCHKLNSNFVDVQILYEKIRLNRVNQIQKMSFNQARFNHLENPLLVSVRNNLMKYSNVIPKRLHKILEYDALSQIETELSK